MRKKICIHQPHQPTNNLRKYIDLPRHKSPAAQALKPVAIWLAKQGYDVPTLKAMSELQFEDLIKRYEKEQN